MASATECTSAQLGARSANLSADLEAMKITIMAGIDSKLSQNEETMWKRGLKEIKRLQSEQQETLGVVSDLQEKQEALAIENQQLRTALCEVTSKFEQVVNEMRQALRQLPQGGSHHGQLSPSPSAASTAASDATAPGLGGLLHAAELAQGRVHVGHLERALQRYMQLPETFEEAWVKLVGIGEKARLVSELNSFIEHRLEVWGNVGDSRDECRTLLAQYEDALRKLQKAALLVLDTQNPKRAAQDESFAEPTPPSSQGNASLTLGLTPTWPTCAPEDAPANSQGTASMTLGLTPTWPTCAPEEATEAFCTPPRASMSSDDQVLLSEACWQTWQGQYRPSPGFPSMAATTAASAAMAASPIGMGGSPAVLSLESALTAAHPGYPSPAAAPSATPPSKVAAAAPGGLKQLQLAECLDEPRSGEGGGAAPTPAPAQQTTARSPWLEAGVQFATPPVGVFKVELQKEHSYMPLGMEVNEVDGTALHVQSIDENGLVGRYNLAQSSESSRVRAGDLILEVNGVHGEPSSMLQECKAQQSLRFAVARGGTGASPTAATAPPPLGAAAGSFSGLDATSAGGSGAGAGAAPRGGADSSELDRVLAEVAAPPVSWGRLRPEARVFVPSSAQAADKKPPAESPDSEHPAPQEAESRDAPSELSAPVPSSPGATEGDADGEDEVVRALFP